MKNSVYLIAAILAFTAGNAFSQCNPLAQLPTGTCQTAPVICASLACYTTGNNQSDNNYAGFCGANTAIHNPQYFRFVPAVDSVEIWINVLDCENGEALQSAILGSCPASSIEVLDCDPGTNPGGSMILRVNDLHPGQDYFLLIDGANGALCRYSIFSTTGVMEPEITGVFHPDSSYIDNHFICQGTTGVTFHNGPSIHNANAYYLITDWSDDTIYSVTPDIVFDVPIDVSPGLHEICIGALNLCDTTSAITCNSILIGSLSPDLEIDGTDMLCATNGFLAYTWYACDSEEVISTDQCFVPQGPGCYCVAANVFEGCTQTDCVDMTVSNNEIIEGAFGIFPNPVDNVLHLKGDILEDSGKYSILDVSGKSVVSQKTYTEYTIPLNITLSPGMYTLLLEGKDGRQYSHRFIKR